MKNFKQREKIVKNSAKAFDRNLSEYQMTHIYYK